MKTRFTYSTCLAVTSILCVADAAAEDWTTRTIAPVTNPIFFESPLIQSEIRPIFAFHRAENALLGTDVDVRLYAVQARWAINDRWAIIATKDGYIELETGTGTEVDGWADVGAGVKYNLYRNDEQQIMVTPGFTFEFPIGDSDVFQGNGDGELNLFVSAIKGWDDLHLTANVGGRIPFDTDEETANIRASLMVDYYVSRWFIPFVTLNAFTTLTEGNARPFDTEGFDLINFGSSDAKGETQAAVGIGFRSRLLDNLDLGVAYENGFTHDDDIFRDRFTVDMIWRF